MILIDTSVWVDHIRRADGRLTELLDADMVLGHPFVIGELAVGTLPNRAIFLRDLKRLPLAQVARHHEVLAMIERENLFGRGLGYVDIHLLASARLSNGLLWTRDRRLGVAADDLGVHFERP